MKEHRVDCIEIRDALLAGATPSGPAVEGHLRGCEGCAELLRGRGELARALSRPETPPPATDAIWTSLEKAVRAETGPRAWLRSRSTPVRLSIAAAAAALLVLAGGFAMGANGSVELLLVWLAVFSVAALSNLWLLVAPLGRPSPSAAFQRGLALLSLGLPFAYALAPTGDESMVAAEHGFVEQAFGCFAYGSVLALPFIAVVWALDRSDRPWFALLAGVAAAAGLVANAVLAVHCPSTERLHIVAGHATIGIALAALGALLGGSKSRVA